MGIFARLIGLEYLEMWEEKFIRIYSPYFEEQTNRFRDEGLDELIEAFACNHDTIQILSGLLVSVFEWQLNSKPPILKEDRLKSLEIQKRFFDRIFGETIGKKAFLTYLILRKDKEQVTLQFYEWLSIGSNLANMYYKGEYQRGPELRSRLNDISKSIFQSYYSNSNVSNNMHIVQVTEQISLKTLFVKILSELPQIIVSNLENHLDPTSDKDSLRTLRQNRIDITIEIFYFIYHLLERQLLHLSGTKYKDVILNCAASEALLDLELKHGNKTNVSLQILDNLKHKFEEYCAFSDVVCVSNAFEGPSVINHPSLPILMRQNTV